MIRALPRVALQFWIVLYIVFFGAEVIHLEPTLRVITQILYGVPLAVWGLWRLRGPVDRLDWSVIGLLIVFAAICLVSRDRTESLGALGLATAYTTWFLLMRRLANSDPRASLVVAIATGLTISLAYNAWLLVDEKLTYLAGLGAAPFEGLVVFPWQSVNAMPIVVLLTIPFLGWLPRGPMKVALTSVTVLSAAVVIPLSVGRAGWLGLAVATVGLSALSPRLWRVLLGLQVRYRAAALVGAVGLLSGGLILTTPRIVGGLAESGRILLWSQATAMVPESPLTGVGPGTFSWMRLAYEPREASLLGVPLAHNTALQTLVEVGVLGLIALAVALVVFALTAWNGRARLTLSGRIGISVLIGYAVSTTLDDFSYLPTITALVITVGAFLTPLDMGSALRNGPSRSPAFVVVTILLLLTAVSLPSVVSVDAARASAQRGRTAMTMGAYSDAQAAFDTATRLHPESGAYWLGLGMAASYDAQTTLARSAYQRAIRASPGDPRGYGGLAALIDNETERLRLLREAADSTTGDPEYSVRLGLLLADMGQVTEATDAWAHAVALRPEVLRAIPYGRHPITPDDVATRALRIEIQHPRPGPAEHATTLWDLGLGLDLLPGSADFAWLAVDAARHGQLDEALTLANAAVDEAPYSARGYQALAAVAAFRCDADLIAAALDYEHLAQGAFDPPPADPRIAREFTYREVGLAATQPPGARVQLVVQRWPWSLVDRPDCS